LFYCVLFYSFLFYCVLFHSFLFYCILFFCLLFCSRLFYFVLFYSILFCSVPFFSILPHLSNDAGLSVWLTVWTASCWIMSAVSVQNCIPVLVTPTEVREYVFKRQINDSVNADLTKRWMHVLHHVLFGSIDCHQAVTVSFSSSVSCSRHSVILHAPRVLASRSHFCPEAGLRSATFPKQAFFTYLTFRSRLSDAQRPACNYSCAHCFASSDPRLISLLLTILTRVEDCSFDLQN